MQYGNADIFRFITALKYFKDARNLLLESHNDGIIDDDEFILLYKGNFSKNPEFPHEAYERLDLDAMDDTECKADFASQKVKSQTSWSTGYSWNIFFLPPRHNSSWDRRTRSGVKTTDLPACRYSDLIPRFGRPVPELSMICNIVLDYITTHMATE